MYMSDGTCNLLNYNTTREADWNLGENWLINKNIRVRAVILDWKAIFIKAQNVDENNLSFWHHWISISI